MFFNLGTLNDHIQSIEKHLLENFQIQLADYLDLKQLSKTKDCMSITKMINVLIFGFD